MPPYPPATKLAEMLDEAATYFRKAVEPARKVPGMLKFGRKSKAAHGLHEHGRQRFEPNNRTLAR
jgi:hypothetical protein